MVDLAVRSGLLGGRYFGMGIDNGGNRKRNLLVVVFVCWKYVAFFWGDDG